MAKPGTAIAKNWDAHVQAHNTVSVKSMADTYDDNCYISYYDVANQKRTEFTGVEGKNAFALEHLDSLKMNNGDPTTNIHVTNFFYGNTLFNQWNIKSDSFSYKDGADYFIFGDNGLITHHYQWYFGTKLVKSFASTKDPEEESLSTVVATSTVPAAGRSSCFGAHHHFIVISDIEGILNTFTDDVFISFFNITTNSVQQFKGQKEARFFYNAFLKLMATIPDGDFAEEDNQATNGNEPKDTLSFSWKAPKAGIKKANDMFLFGEENKISELWMCYECPELVVLPGI